MSDKIKVIYISGSARSGSTILGNILGGLNQFFNTGELIEIWDNGKDCDELCGCGDTIHDCKIWKRVIRKMYDDIPNFDIFRCDKIRRNLLRSKKTIFSHFFSQQNGHIANDVNLVRLESRLIVRRENEWTLIELQRR